MMQRQCVPRSAGIHAASFTYLVIRLKRHECRAPVGRTATTMTTDKRACQTAQKIRESFLRL